MSMMTIGGSLVSGLYSLATPVPSVPQDRIIGSYMNSLYNNGDGVQTVPFWLHRMAVADGGKSIQERGDFGFAVDGSGGSEWFFDPPLFDRTFALGVTTPGGTISTWSDVDAIGFTDLIIVPDNFAGPPTRADMTDDPNVGGIPPGPGGTDTYPVALGEILGHWEANSALTPNIWLYMGWGNGSYDQIANGATPTQFETWKARTTTTYGYRSWFDDLLAEMKSDTPAAAGRMNLIPTASILVSVMDNTPASAMTSDDWFYDDSPHGNDSTYLIAAAIVYSAMFEQAAPQPDFSGTSIHSSITSNWATIASHIASEVGL